MKKLEKNILIIYLYHFTFFIFNFLLKVIFEKLFLRYIMKYMCEECVFFYFL